MLLVTFLLSVFFFNLFFSVELFEHLREFVACDELDDLLIAPVAISYGVRNGARVAINQPISLEVRESLNLSVLI